MKKHEAVIAGNLSLLTGLIEKADPMQKSFLDHAVGNLNSQEKEDFERYLQYCLNSGQTLDFLAQSYNQFVADTRKEQMYFRRHGTYRSSTYEQVKSQTYLNKDFMQMYMFGLAISNCLWPNHTAFYRWFKEKIPKTASGRYLEVGPGHGFYLMTAMRQCAYDFYEAVDISPTSVEMTKSVLDSKLFGNFDHYNVAVGDFLQADFKEPFAAIVMGEVIEHVENPEAFLLRLKKISTPDSFIFLTTAINAPEVDHIFLFDSVESVEEIVTKCGLSVKDKLALPYFGTKLAESVADRLPINIALILQNK